MLYRTLILVLIVFLCAGKLPAQMFYFNDSLNILKLEQQLQNVSGKEWIDIQNQIAALLVLTKPTKALNIAKLAKIEADKKNYRSGSALAVSNIGFYYFLKNDYSNAYENQLYALDIIEGTNNRELEILILERIGYIYYFSRADIQRIVDHFGEIIRYYEKIGDENKVASTLIIEGGGSFRYGQYDESFNSFTQFLEHTKNLEVPRIEKLIVYYSLGDLYFLMHDLKNCWFYYKKCLELKDVDFIEESALMANIYLKIGNYYEFIHKTDSALHFYNQALNLSSDIYYAKGMMKAQISLGKFYGKNGNDKKAISAYYSAYHYGAMIDSMGSFFFHPRFDYLIDVSEESWMSSPGEFKKHKGKLGMEEALIHLVNLNKSNFHIPGNISIINKLLSIKDSLINYQISKEIIDLGLKYESEKKEQKIQLLEKENELNSIRAKRTRSISLGLAAFTFISILWVILYIRQTKLRTEKDKMKIKQKLMRSQMNPHFIFNSLSSIQSSIINEEPDKAVKYLSRFSKLMRNILDSSQEETISLAEELSTVENYLELQKIRFPRKFNYSIELDENIDTKNTFTPPMLAQPFIENAIEHGIKQKDTKGNIRVRFKLNGNNILYEVEDDGIGRDKAQEILLKQDKIHRSMATSITTERIQVLNKRSKKKITLDIIDLKDAQGKANGTKVVFKLPFS